MIRVKRAYDAPHARDGARYFVERLWARGMKKEALRIEGWLKDIAPSAELRKWYGHDPDKWAGFRTRYRAELRANREALRPLLDAARKGTITLVYSARDTEHNSAIVLKAFLEEQLKQGERG